MKEKLMNKATKFKDNDSGQIASIEYLVGICTTIVVLIAIFEIVPLIGYHLDNSVSVAPNSDWNSTNNPDIETGISLWESIGPLLTLASIISVLAVVIATIIMLRGGGLGGA